MVSELFEEVKAPIQANTTKLAKINEQHPRRCLRKLARFVMSEKTLNSLQILEDSLRFRGLGGTYEGKRVGHIDPQDLVQLVEELQYRPQMGEVA
jgi:hypothetical protein